MAASLDSLCRASPGHRPSTARASFKRNSPCKVDSTCLWGNDFPGVRCTTEAPACLDADDHFHFAEDFLSSSFGKKNDFKGNDGIVAIASMEDHDIDFDSNDGSVTLQDASTIEGMVIELRPRFLTRATQKSETLSPLLFRMGISFPTIQPSHIAAEENKEASSIPSCRHHLGIRGQDGKKRKNRVQE